VSLVCVCGQPKASRATKCRDCWKTRGSDGGEAQYVGQCGHPVSHKRAKWCRACFNAGRHLEPTLLHAADSSTVPLTSFEDAWAQWQRAIGMMHDRYHGPGVSHGQEKDVVRFLVVPDIHAPFHERDLFAAMIARERGRIDRAICIGDLGDAYALSRFLKYERVPYREEWAEVTAVMQALSEAFPAVEIVIGNHDARLEKALRNHLTEDMVDAVQLMTGGTLCPLSAIARQFPNITIAKHATPNGHVIDWFTTVGDAWLGHPEKFSVVPGSVGRGVSSWLDDNELALGLDQYRLLVIGHTHAYIQMPWKSGTLVCECGTLAKQLGYMHTPRIGGRPQRRGYLTFSQRNGRTDLNSVRFVWLDQDEALRAS